MTKTYDKMTTNHAKVPLGKSQDPPLGGSVRDCRSSGLKDKKSGPFTLLVLMIGAVFQKLPRISRKIHGSAAGCSFHHAQLVRVHACPLRIELEESCSVCKKTYFKKKASFPAVFFKRWCRRIRRSSNDCRLPSPREHGAHSYPFLGKKIYNLKSWKKVAGTF